jgi:uncharacterized protein (DUF1684 family)
VYDVAVIDREILPENPQALTRYSANDPKFPVNSDARGFSRRTTAATRFGQPRGNPGVIKSARVVREDFALRIRHGWPLLLLLNSLASGADAAYQADLEKWRQDFDADVRTGGWLTLIGRFQVAEGVALIGSATTSTVRLQPGISPRRLATLTRHADSFEFAPARAVAATIDGGKIAGSVTLSTTKGRGRVRVGRLELVVRRVGDDYYLLVSDSQNPAIHNFKGTTWFPIDPSYRVPAAFTAYTKPETVQVPMTRVDSKILLTSDGDVTFQLAGKTVRLKSFTDSDGLFVMFQDQTNGKETYPGGRYLHAELPKDGATVLDFNKAFNPYCSVNVYVMCPISPAENSLAFGVPVGERYSAHE